MLRCFFVHFLLAALLSLGLLVAQAAAQGSDPLEETAERCDPIFDDDCEESGLAKQTHFPDPWERFNRGSLRFNDGVDTWFFDPITTVYRWLPDPVESALYRIGLNLDAPAIMINDGLQLEWADMRTTFSRFLINSSVGLAGIFDPAEALGFERHGSDFGQTLTLAGLPSGPYLILPAVGPTTVRDGSGALVDLAMNPLVYFFGLASFEAILQAGGSGIVIRAEKIQELQSLEQGSVDFYAALRSAFYQNRQADIWGRREDRRGDAASVQQPAKHGSPGAMH